ncbi:MAG: hypothetical protein NkDv07_0020 [Candidatus Improbicoccus devescovinae]|nr:MAG: hypothetical protein NkDv07_0020 [Candidatus Improbicoccus devescovinae]
MRANHLSSSTIALWFAIVSKANELYWMDEFGFSIPELEIWSGLKKNVIQKARNQLKQAGFIDFRSRGSNKCAFYKVIPAGNPVDSSAVLTEPHEVSHDMPHEIPQEMSNHKTIQYQTKQENINTAENTNVFSRSIAMAIAPPKQENAAIKNKNFSVLFEKFWSMYPKKVAKQAAFRIFRKISKIEETLNLILAGLERWKLSEQWQNPQFIPYPATFLAQKRWEDEIPNGGDNFGKNKRKNLCTEYPE